MKNQRVSGLPRLPRKPRPTPTSRSPAQINSKLSCSRPEPSCNRPSTTARASGRELNLFCGASGLSMLHTAFISPEVRPGRGPSPGLPDHLAPRGACGAPGALGGGGVGASHNPQALKPRCDSLETQIKRFASPPKAPNPSNALNPKP